MKNYIVFGILVLFTETSKNKIKFIEYLLLKKNFSINDFKLFFAFFNESFVSVLYGESSDQEVTMSCERTCLSKCSTKLESVFTISDDHEEAEIPDEDCYDEYLRDQMDEDDLEVCKKSELDPLTGSEQVDLNITIVFNLLQK